MWSLVFELFHLACFFLSLFLLIYFWREIESKWGRSKERQRQRDTETERHRETEREFQAGSVLSAQSPMWGSISQIARSRPEPKSRVKRLTGAHHLACF